MSRDYILNYYYQAILPLGYKGIYFLLTSLCTPPTACKLVTVFLSLLFIGSIVATSRFVAGLSAGFISLILATGAVIKNNYFMGGLQRGFGIALMSLMIHSLIKGRFGSMCVLTLLSFSIYPAGGILCMSTLVLFSILPRTWGGYNGSMHWRKRALVLVGVSAGVMCIVGPQLAGGARYGERLSLRNEAEFPEWGPEGRYTQGDRGVPVPLWRSVYSEFLRTVVAIRQVNAAPSGEQMVAPKTLAVIVTASITLCSVIMWWLDGCAVSLASMRMLIFSSTAVGSYLLATGLFPLLYIPSRYVILAVPCLILIAIPVMISRCVSRLLGACPLFIHRIATVLVGCVICVTLGWHALTVKPLSSVDGYRELFRFIQRLPRNVVIAGWPRGMLSTIPFFTGRTVLIYEEGHQIFHRKFLLEMRRRMDATMAVFAAVNSSPLEQLRRDFKVTHLVITRKQLQRAPRYFAPFGYEMAKLRESRRGQTLALERIVQNCFVFKANDLLLLDLSCLDRPWASHLTAEAPATPNVGEKQVYITGS